MAAGQTGLDGRRWRTVYGIILGVTAGAGITGCGNTTFDPGYEFRVEGTVTAATSSAAAYAVVTGELYEGACNTGVLKQRSQARAGADGRFSVGFASSSTGVFASRRWAPMCRVLPNAPACKPVVPAPRSCRWTWHSARSDRGHHS